MATPGLNIIIVAENALIAHGLKNQLRLRFGISLKISCVCDFKALLKTVNKDTEVVITDPMMDGKKGSDVLRSVKLINPSVAGIINNSAQEVLDSVEGILHALPQASGHFYAFAYN